MNPKEQKLRRHFAIQLSESVLLVWMLVIFGENFWAQSNQILGDIELVGATKVEKTSGVWVDGQYLGYLKELKGSKKILLLPGEHQIVVRQDGYQDFTNNITVRPGEKQTISVKMLKDPRFKMPSVFSEIKLSMTQMTTSLSVKRFVTYLVPRRTLTYVEMRRMEWRPSKWLKCYIPT